MKAYHIKNKAIISSSYRMKQRCMATIAAVFLLMSPTAFAHKLNMFAYVEGDQIFAEGYFTDGKKAKNSTITVFDAADKQLLQGTSDADGQFTFAIPQQSDLRITVNAGMGHQAEFVLLKDELSEETADTNNEPASVLSSDNEATSSIAVQTPLAVTNLDNDAIRAEVERAVGKAIKPLMRELSTMRAEKSLADIIGGIGFIFGLFGVAMYFKSRKQQ
jgi:nickel transport protein